MPRVGRRAPGGCIAVNIRPKKSNEQHSVCYRGKAPVEFSEEQTETKTKSLQRHLDINERAQHMWQLGKLPFVLKNPKIIATDANCQFKTSGHYSTLRQF